MRKRYLVGKPQIPIVYTFTWHSKENISLTLFLRDLLRAVQIISYNNCES